MARNKVKFQKGLSEAQFAVLHGTEDQCREAVVRWRWPSGFVCPVCAGEHHSLIKTRALYQCTACRRQTSVIAGPLLGVTNGPLRAAPEPAAGSKPIRLNFAPREGFAPSRNRALGAAQFPSRQHRCQ